MNTEVMNKLNNAHAAFDKAMRDARTSIEAIATLVARDDIPPTSRRSPSEVKCLKDCGTVLRLIHCGMSEIGCSTVEDAMMEKGFRAMKMTWRTDFLDEEPED